MRPPVVVRAWLRQPRRAASDFAYVAAAPVAPRRHALAFRESDRSKVWRHAGIPVLDDGAPEAARGRLLAFYAESIEAHETRLDELEVQHPELYNVAALIEGLDAAQVLPADELAALLAPPTEVEKSSLATSSGRYAALAALRADVETLTSAAAKLEEDSIDSGEVDLALPLDQSVRETLQRERAAPLLRAALSAARAASLLTWAQDAARSPMQRAQLADDELEAAIPLASPRGYEGAARAAGVDSRGELDRPLTAEELKGYAGRGETLEAIKAAVLAQRDQSAFLPRKRLPSRLGDGAPTPQLADAARLIDDNVSLAAADKAYVMQYYADALAGKEEAFLDAAADKAAWFDPQPQWGVYDPALVKLQVRSTAARASECVASLTRCRLIRSPLLRSLPHPLTAGHGVRCSRGSRRLLPYAGHAARGRCDRTPLRGPPRP